MANRPLSAFSELSSVAQAAYAQLLESALAVEHSRTVADLPGSFVTKSVKGREYWYYQYTEPSGRLRQLYVGPDNDAVKQLVNRKADKPVTDALLPMARSALALGCAGLLPRHYQVIRRLADYGFFHAGGTLIGTHAFLAYGNMLGVGWGGSARTQDIDFAHPGKSVSLLLAPDFDVHIHEAIESLGMGLLPVASLTSAQGASYLNPREPDFRLDFLTVRHRNGDAPYEHPKLHITLQPLKFMEFSLENIQQAALISTAGVVLANVPHPARFALHKLIVYGEREGAFAAKANKDLAQAASLLAAMKQHRAWEVEEAWADLASRGKGWLDRARHGLNALERFAPEIEASAWLEKRKTSRK
ncbi:MAG: nucleotidyltransferase domain-containing protein [Betaproteobacteria bacterium]|nr:nucleotidyltransferase domain-containing protein [Betaproteobacteria bacterium]